MFHLLQHIDVNKATGPDRIAGRILKELAKELTIPLTILGRRILAEACWPDRWREHFLVPIYKKKSVYDRNNYRGVHLTSIVAKTIERAIGNPLIMYLQDHGFGTSQWAFRKMSSSRDLVLVCVSQWILAICSGFKIGAYLGDITAAFDRVDKDLLMGKLHSLGVADVFLDFLNNYLEPRIGRVALEGALSEIITLADMVFQGTVLGPALWNAFFQDITTPAEWQGGESKIFADDLSVFKKFPMTVSNEVVKADMELTRNDVHKWGSRNRVAFDATKEHIIIIHPVSGEGEPVKQLGCLIDMKLTMVQAIDHIVNVARPKIKAMLRTRGTYNVYEMIQQYKTHIWGLTEYHNGAIYHASGTALAKLDRLQASFLEELRMTEEVAFLDHNFAPSELRRDIGILGFLHKRVLEKCHVGLVRLLPMDQHEGKYHNRQLESFVLKCTSRHVLFNRSLFGMIGVYNRMPQWVVDADTVPKFQTALTQMARRRCVKGGNDWKLGYHGCFQWWRTLALAS